MKVPRISEGEDPAAIVSFEMEQMILPRLSGPHVPACFGTGDFAPAALCRDGAHSRQDAVRAARRTAAPL